MNVRDTVTLLTIAGATTTGTAIDVSRVDEIKNQIVLTANTGNTTVTVEGTVVTTSTGTIPYDVNISVTYNFIRSRVTAVASTGSVGTVTSLLQTRACC